MKIRLSIVLLAHMAMGCAEMKLSQGGSKVRFVNTTPTGCEYIGEIKGRPAGAFIRSDQIEEAKIDIKNRAANKGANTVELTGSNFSMTENHVTGEAYRCP